MPHGFDQAITWLKHGRWVYRTGWHGADMYVALQSPDANSKMTLPYLYLSTPESDLVPWLASQTDMLADDWELHDHIPDDSAAAAFQTPNPVGIAPGEIAQVVNPLAEPVEPVFPPTTT